MVQVLKVAVPVPLRQLFDYLPKKGELPPIGGRCEITFGRRKLIGVAWEFGEAQVAEHTLKPITRSLDNAPILSKDLLELCRKAAAYYHHPIGEVIATALPASLRKGETATIQGELIWRITAKGTHAQADNLTRAPRQKEALLCLQQHPSGLSRPALTSFDIRTQALNALAKKGWAELVEQAPSVSSWQQQSPLSEAPLVANQEQNVAITAINNTTSFTPFLLDGITGSGKTEVYLQTIAERLMAKQQVLVLVPEIGLTPQTIQRFKQRFSVPIHVLHSGLTDKERLHSWQMAAEGQAAIIIGTRSAIFTPMQNLGLIVVDEAHDNSFKQQDGFRYSARDLAIWRAQILNIPVVLGTATPTLEHLYNAQQGRFTHLQLRQRTGRAQAPSIHIEDCSNLTPLTPLSEHSLSAIHRTLQQGRQALVFINRRGYAPLLLCGDCGWQSECPHCDAHMTWHRVAQQLRCHHCDTQRPIPQRCPNCGSHHLLDRGAGTEKLEELLAAQFPQYPLIRIDRDTTRRKGSLAKQLASVHQGEPCVLVGTQMLAKGHHFNHLDLAVMLEADAGFMSADFRGPEQAAQLILQVAGRTGRENTSGRLLVQTRQPDNPLLRLLCQGDYHRFAAELMKEREMAGFPPFGHLALFRAESIQPSDAQQLLEAAASPLWAQQEVMVLGPAPAPMERRQGRYRAQLLLLAPERRTLHHYIPQLIQTLSQHPLTKRTRWHLDIDPVDLT